MPIAGQRDPDETRAVLVAWLERQLPEATELAVTDLVIPTASGFSNETFLFDASWSDAAGAHHERFVLRAQPSVYALFPHIDILEQQYLTMKLLGEHSDVPVARMRWAEPDPSVLGTPFFVMDRLEGQVPGDDPPYTIGGWFMELPPAERRRIHEAGVDAMCRVHLVDWRAAGFGHLDRADRGALGPEQRRNYFRWFWEWARDGVPHPVADPAWAWLEANWPDDAEHVALCWGDARPGNQMFRDGRCVGVFDWEMVSLGNPESDLGWWLFMQRFHTEGIGVPQPEGLLTRDEVIARWEATVGRPATHVDFYEILGGFHFTIIMMRLGRMRMELSPEDADPDFAVHNPGPVLTAKLLGLS
jgi:aminoglycoside phosphotransferase (APT) family kinase protein